MPTSDEIDYPVIPLTLLAIYAVGMAGGADLYIAIELFVLLRVRILHVMPLITLPVQQGDDYVSS
jgi:uncharacterized membrane protein YecN with MAPEG domain